MQPFGEESDPLHAPVATHGVHFGVPGGQVTPRVRQHEKTLTDSVRQRSYFPLQLKDSGRMDSTSFFNFLKMRLPRLMLDTLPRLPIHTPTLLNDGSRVQDIGKQLEASF